MSNVARGAVLAGVLLLAACGWAPRGVYQDASGVTRLRFSPDGSVTLTVAGATHRARYRVDGDAVWIVGCCGEVPLHRSFGSALVGPMGLILNGRCD